VIYQIEFKPRAINDMKSLTPEDRRRIMLKIEALQDSLAGDVKRLTNFTPEYRLRVGTHRVLFETVGDKVLIYRIKHRRDAYS
jgi:mRNA interferase RelE/StbE